MSPRPIADSDSQYAGAWRDGQGLEVMIRPIRPEDEPLMIRFHATLSERSVYLRYFHLMNLDARVEHERLARICFIDYHHAMALVAERDGEILAVGRLSKVHDANQAEFALLISDEFQGHGLGTELLRRLIGIARAEKLEKVTAEILPENDHMLRICRLAGFRLHHDAAEHVVKAELSLH